MEERPFLDSISLLEKKKTLKKKTTKKKTTKKKILL